MDDQSEDVILPALPHGEPSLPSIPSFSRSNTRKRPFIRSHSYQPRVSEDQLAEAINTSSDPALFSCDETPDAENYSGNAKRRKKKTYKGTWWDDTNHGPMKKRSFRRNFDSGIFMDDDSSNTDLSSESLLERELLDAQSRTITTTCKQDEAEAQHDRTDSKRRVHRSFKFSKEEALKRMPQGRPINPKDHLIRTVVQTCLDKNNETVDWTGWSLDYLPPAITDLKFMIKRIQAQSVNDKLAPFEAELKILLGNNEFSQFPEPLLELTNTQLLSLRQNKLSELPPGIRTLVNLQELNISSNNLKYLPYEVIQLLRYGALKVINHSPNPWMSLPAAEELFTEAPALAFVTIKNVVIRRLAVSKPEEILPDGSATTATGAPGIASRQPHLSEVVLRSLLRHNLSKADLSSYLSEDHPESTRELLHLLHKAQTLGGHVCSFCKHDIVLPRYQWYEWWDISGQNLSSLIQEHHASGFDGKNIVGFYLDHPETLTTAATMRPEVLDRLIPFRRIACGCTEPVAGMANEVEEFQENAAMMSISLPSNEQYLKMWHWSEERATKG